MTSDAVPSRLPEFRALENSEQEFITRFAAHAASGTLYPQIEGSPLLEFSAGGRVLFLFDRMGPYASVNGPARVIVHGLVEAGELHVLDQAEATEEKLMPSAISAVEGQGRVVLASRRTVVVQARLPLVLSVLEGQPGLQVGDWVQFRTQPPLHGFLVK